MAALVCCRGWPGLGQSIPRRFPSSLVRVSASPWRQTRGLSQLLAFGLRQPSLSRLGIRNSAGEFRRFQHLSRPNHVSTFSTSSKHKDKPESGIPTAAEQRKNDWSIVKRLMTNVWPKNDWKTRLTVIIGFVLLVTAKVCKMPMSFLFVDIKFYLGFECASASNLQVNH